MKECFSEAQIIGFLGEAEAGLPIKELCRRHGFSEASYYLWRSKFGGMSVPDAKRLKELETENTRLKKLLAELLLEMEVTREALSNHGFHAVPIAVMAQLIAVISFISHHIADYVCQVARRYLAETPSLTWE